MIICCCNNVNENTLRNLIKCNKIKSIKQFRKIQDNNGCGKCYPIIKKMLNE